MVDKLSIFHVQFMRRMPGKLLTQYQISMTPNQVLNPYTLLIMFFHWIYWMKVATMLIMLVQWTTRDRYNSMKRTQFMVLFQVPLISFLIANVYVFRPIQLPSALNFSLVMTLCSPRYLTKEYVLILTPLRRKSASLPSVAELFDVNQVHIACTEEFLLSACTIVRIARSSEPIEQKSFC